ncbi:hypothetical protein HIM_04963 [Hirsutella minnesotensis 3608]|uniref:Tyrosine specific protein phosphatases domain-containing protein n=1 Tax=Hirsutella minnesotensis 3608 TaxID=1043627 RepID=A0A0F7ZKZ4_9HYPO|nr:hypothetical protein HIM_04963 [Hirsutella minnesotensis 3608]
MSTTTNSRTSAVVGLPLATSPQGRNSRLEDFIEIDGLFNVREFGGYKTTSERVTRQGFILRSGHLEDITFRGREQLAKLGITVRLDLRSPNERHAFAGHDALETANSALPPEILVPLQDGDFSVRSSLEKYKGSRLGMASRMAQHYFDTINSSTGRLALRDVLLYVHDHPRDKILLHCTLGKDRTGVVIALLQALAGVPAESIVDDFALSEAGLRPVRARFVHHCAKLVPNASQEQVKHYADNVLQSDGKCMRMLLQMIERGFGGVDGYFEHACDLSEAQLCRVKNLLLEPL